MYIIRQIIRQSQTLSYYKTVVLWLLHGTAVGHDFAPDLATGEWFSGPLGRARCPLGTSVAVWHWRVATLELASYVPLGTLGRVDAGQGIGYPNALAIDDFEGIHGALR